MRCREGRWTLQLKLKTFRHALIQTQLIREDLVKRLQRQLGRAEAEAERTVDPHVKAEWTRLVGFMAQTINSLLKVYDEVKLNEDLKELQRLIQEAKEWKAKLEEHEKELAIKEAELEKREKLLAAKEAESNRKLEGSQKGEGVNSEAQNWQAAVQG
jgi:hypothetical protein